MKVLILSTPEDPAASAVEKQLLEIGAQTEYLRFDELKTSRLFYMLGETSERCLIEKHDGVSLDLQSYNAVWHRRPGRVQVDKFAEPWIERMILEETQSGLDGMFASLQCLWVNHPRRDFVARQKLWQLNLAAELGLKIPRTLVTNDPKRVQDFYESCSGKVVYKLIAENSNFAVPANENPRGICTLPLRKEDLQFLDQVCHSLHLFQDRIEKAHDLRVTIVGKKVFCARIDSQEGQGKIDWRQDYSVNMEPCELPDDIAAVSLELMRRLGLNYGALDFCVTPEGEHIFFEINCAGQYLWLEKRCGLPISAEIAGLLAGKRQPLVPPGPGYTAG